MNQYRPINIMAVAAATPEGGIGYKGGLPWPRNSADLEMFKKITMGSSMVMGRKTFESIGSKPLPGRMNIVMTSNPQRYEEGGNLRFVNRMESVIEIAHQHDPSDDLIAQNQTVTRRLCVIGGGEIYRMFLPLCTVIFISRFRENYASDTFFPEMGDEWRQEPHPGDMGADLAFDVELYSADR